MRAMDKKELMTGDEYFWFKLFRDNNMLEAKETPLEQKEAAPKEGPAEAPAAKSKAKPSRTDPVKGKYGKEKPADGRLKLSAMIGYGILISVPVIGLIAGIILALKRNRPERSDFAIACLVLRIFFLVGSFLVVYGMIEFVFMLSQGFGG